MSEPFGQQILEPTGVVRASQARKGPMGKLSPTCSTRRRLIAVVVVVSAIALVSPAGIVRAQTGGTSNSVTVSSSTATGMALGAAAQYQVKHATSWKAYEDIMILATLNGAAKMAANTGHPMTTQDYGTLAAQTKNWFDSRAPETKTFLSQNQADRLRYGFDVLFSFTGPVATAAFGGLIKLDISELERTLDPTKQAAAISERYDRAMKAIQGASDQVQQAYSLSMNDPQLAAAIDPVLFELTGLNTKSSVSDLTGLYPNAFPNLPKNSDGSFRANTSDLMNQYESLVSNTQSDTKTDMADLKSVSDYQLTNVFPVDPSTHPSPLPPGNTDNPDQRQALRQLKLDAAQSSITALSKLIGLSDPQLGQQVSTVGGAAVQIGEAVSTYLHTTETWGAATSGLAGAALTGNIIGAAVDIFGAFQPGGPSPDQVILQQIQALSQQIEQLHQDMDTRFDRVDASLNNVLTVLNQNFAQINYSLGVLNGNVADIESGLLQIQAELNRIEQYLLAWTTSLSKEQFIQTMNGCLGYRARTGGDIGFSQYANCENAAYTHAHDTAINQLWAGLDTPDYTDSNIYPTLSNFPLSVDVNYLAQFPTKNLNLPPLSTGRLANPNEWALGVRAYLQLAGEWPQYASQINSSRLVDLINVGAALQQADQNVNSIKSGNTISGNQPLFAAVENNYGIAISGLQSAAQGLANSYIANPANGITNSSNGITLSLWAGGANQQASWRPSVGSIGFCNGGGDTLTAAPSNLFSFAPDLYAFAQGYLSSGVLTMCISRVQWVNSIDPFTYPPFQPTALIYCLDRSYDLPPGVLLYYYRLDDCDIAQLRTTVTVFFYGTPILSASVTSSDYLVSWFHAQVCGVDGNCTGTRPVFQYSADPNYAVQFVWNASYRCGLGPDCGVVGDVLSKLTNSPTVTQQPQPQLLSTIAANIDAVAAKHQQNIYGNISGAFGIVGPLQSAGQSLTAGKLLSQAFVDFGLPNSLQTNDGLHSLLYGNQSILDAVALQSDFLAFSTFAIPDTTVNKITVEIATTRSRLAALSTYVTGALSRVQQSQLPELLYQIEATLQDLQAFKALKDGEALSPCTYVLSPASASFGSAGGIGTISIQELNGCNWIASTNSNWLTTILKASGTGNGTVTYFVSSNTTAPPRDAIFIIGDQVFHVTQAINSGTGGGSGGGGGGGGGGGATPDFALPLTVGQQTLTAGARTSYSISVSSVNGFTGTVGFTVTGLPGGVSGTFNPPTVNGGAGSTILNISTAGTTLAGTYPLIIAGTAGSINHFSEAQLVVQGDFVGSIPSAAATVSVGSSAAFSVNLNSVGGFSDQITFSCFNPPQGLTCGFNPTSAMLPANGTVSSQLTVTVYSKPSGSGASKKPIRWPDHRVLIGSQALLLLALLFGWFWQERLSRNWKFAMRILAFALGVFFIAGQTSCGGAVGTAGGSQTPPQTSAHVTLPIQASSSTSTKTVGTLQITVP